jgi:outer membrane lipoprotein carrier protein
MIRRHIFTAVLVAATAATASNAKTSPAAAPVVRALESRYHNARTLKAVFLQRYSDARQSAQAESGIVFFSRPSRMRWEYESPERKLFLADGKSVWFYVPADRTVTRAPMKESTDWRTPLVLLTGRTKLADLCDDIDLSPQAKAATGNVVLRCLPRGTKRAAEAAEKEAERSGIPGINAAQQFDEVYLEVHPSTGELANVRVLQPGGVELEFRFGNWEYNLPLQQYLFHFQPPVGVAIVDAAQAFDAVP